MCASNSWAEIIKDTREINIEYAKFCYLNEYMPLHYSPKIPLLHVVLDRSTFPAKALQTQPLFFATR